ncbi:MAG: hypothetical protein RL328_2170 [Acidobacteriota bacterium]|jgi:hypothetical protein
MEMIQRFAFFPIHFDHKGAITSGLNDLKTNASNFTDLIIFCHGFRNDENDARALYTKFLTNLDPQMNDASLSAKFAGRSFAVAGALWPSMVFKEPNDSGNALSAGNNDRARLTQLGSDLSADEKTHIDAMLANLANAETSEQAKTAMVNALLSLAKLQPSLQHEFDSAFTPDIASTLIAGLSAGDDSGEVIDPTKNTGAGGAQGLGAILGFPAKFLNLTTFLLMFERCGIIGEKGLAEVARQAKSKNADLHIHLIGHSLGGRAVTACAKSLLSAPKLQANSMMLLQAAYSQFGLSPANPRGHFREVIEQQAIQQPILSTHSDHDSVVGFAYTAMATISGNNARAVSLNPNNTFGGIGRNGVKNTPEALDDLLLEAGTATYPLQQGHLHNLNGTRDVGGKPLIDSHGDVRNPHVTWAFANLLAAS